MDLKCVKTLEFDKILRILSGFAVMEPTKDAVLSICPETDIKKVNILQDETASALSLSVKKGAPSIYIADDVRPALARAEMSGVLSIRDILNVGRVLKTARGFKSYADDETNALSEHFEALYEDKKLETKIFTCMIDDETIADDASDALYNIRRKIKSTNNKIRDVLQKIVGSQKHAKHLQEQIITMRDDRFVVPVKAEYRGEIPGILHDTSASGATLFIEPMQVVEANNEVRALALEEKEEIERILREFTALIAENAKIISMTFETIMMLDMIFAKAKFALKYDAYRPILNSEGYIDLKRARHPLLDPEKVVPTDIYLGKDFDTLVITGPNTGGKTVSLKTIGLFTLMAQAGLHITAKEGSVVAVFENVFADIGDEQSIEQSLSTFSSHMVNIVSILKNDTHSSLCLFDELGAGTDPVEGAALAISILEHLKNTGAKCAATTHYSELKSYALTTPRVENASCEFDVDTLSPTYRVLIGVPGKSNAFAISKRLGLSDTIIESAKSHLSTEDKSFEDVLGSLEKNRLEAETDREKAEEYKREIKVLKDELAHRNEKLKEKTDRILENAHAEAKKILESAKESSEEIIADAKRVRKIKSEKEANAAIEKARRDINEKIKTEADAVSKKLFETPKNTKAPKSVMLGETVEIVNLKQRGTVLTLPNSKGDLQVRVGIMNVKTNLQSIRVIEELAPKKPKQKKSSTGGAGKTLSVGSELDVRGQNVEDAIYKIEKFLDDALMSSLGQVRIIHGKGTGVLRSGIHSFLRKQKCVKAFRLGVFGEGDTGVTVVELK